MAPNTNKYILHIMKYYCRTPQHGSTVEHGDQRRVSNPGPVSQARVQRGITMYVHVHTLYILVYTCLYLVHTITSWYRQVHTGMYLEHAYTYLVEVHNLYSMVHSTAFSIHTFKVKAYDSMYSAMKAITQCCIPTYHAIV